MPYRVMIVLVAAALVPVVNRPAIAGDDPGAIDREIEHYASTTPAWQKVAELDPRAVVIYPDDAGGEDAGSYRQPFRFELTTLLWVTGLDGAVEVKGREADVETDGLGVGFVGRAELWTGRWGGWLEITRLRVDGEEDGGAADADAEVTRTSVEAAAAYRFDLGRGWLVEPFAGLRYTSVELDLDLTEPGAAPFSREDDEQWVDPILGVRARFPITDDVYLRLRGDLGGFGIGSDLTVNVAVGAEVRLLDWLHGYAGWRWLDTDYEDGGGVRKFAADATHSGPLLGLLFTF